MTQSNFVRPQAGVRLFLCGFLILFLELVLIRYLAGSVWNMGYFPNLVLMGVFIGMGLGFILHGLVTEERSPLLLQASIGMLGVLVVFLYFKHPVVPGFTTWFGFLGGEVYFTSNPAASNRWDYVIFLLIFLSVITIFSLISQRTAKFFRLFSPLKAYTLDILGSCCGILSFMMVSWLQLPAWMWFLALIPLFLLILAGSTMKSMIPCAMVLLIATFFVWKQDTALLSDRAYAGPLEVSWSPYQKVEYISQPTHFIFVNGISHQNMLDASQLKQSFYSTPYSYRAGRGLPRIGSVLVIGAGAGNDVATALLFGADHVDAIEIDPVIARLGKKHHPAAPYDDPRVSLVVDDARAFMTYTDRKYDLIIFALTDSLVKVSPMAQLRLENYLFTEESVRTASRLLKDGGNLLFYNFYRLPWVKAKIQAMIHEATGLYPVTLGHQKNFTILIVDPKNPGTASGAQEAGLDIPVDDWPFLYLRERGIPSMYLRAMAGLGVLLLALAWLLHRSGRKQGDGSKLGPLKLSFFFMGLAFLLLETKSVIQFSLLFGTTWLNNSLVFLAVLIFVLLANHIAGLAPKVWLLKLAYVAVAGVCLIQLYYPLSNLLQVKNAELRFLYASVLTFSPIFFANLIFSITFRDRPMAEQLFGWNLLGAFAGGTLEYTSMALGYNALSLIVGLSYTVVILLLLLERRSRALVYVPDQG